MGCPSPKDVKEAYGEPLVEGNPGPPLQLHNVLVPVLGRYRVELPQVCPGSKDAWLLRIEGGGGRHRMWRGVRPCPCRGLPGSCPSSDGRYEGQTSSNSEREAEKKAWQTSEAAFWSARMPLRMSAIASWMLTGCLTGESCASGCWIFIHCPERPLPCR